MKSFFNGILIILISIVLAIVYGIIHDLVTANICVEYFTIGHPKIIENESPITMAFLWGIIATWWAGLFIGLLLAFASQVGEWPKYAPLKLIQPILVLLSIMGISALIAGIVGGILFESGSIQIIPRYNAVLLPEKHRPFMIDLFAHSASYFVGFLGGIGLAIWVIIKRWKLSKV